MKNYFVSFRQYSESLGCLVTKLKEFETIHGAYEFAKSIGARIDGPIGEITYRDARKMIENKPI